MHYEAMVVLARMIVCFVCVCCDVQMDVIWL